MAGVIFTLSKKRKRKPVSFIDSRGAKKRRTVERRKSRRLKYVTF